MTLTSTHPLAIVLLAMMSMDSCEVDSLDDDSAVEGWEFMLGGIDMGALSATAWENHSDHSSHNIEDESIQSPTDTGKLGVKSKQQATAPVTTNAGNTNHAKLLHFSAVQDDDEIFARAHACTVDGRLQRPPLYIVHAGKELGNICLASTAIRKGETIFTERAAVASNVSTIRACPYCFRSLEPASSCCQSESQTCIPMPHLWPVADLDKNALQPVNQHLFIDAQRRLFCTQCDHWFCNTHCLEALEQEMGVDHCTIHQIQQALSTLDENVQAAVRLAIPMFLRLLAHYRRCGQLEGTFLDGLCGEEADVGPLELGVETTNTQQQEETPRYILEPFYNLLLQKLRLSQSEQEALDLTVFQRLAAIAARNSVGFRTKSPFKIYHAALLRNCGGWGSPQHQTHMTDLAQACGRSELDRTMDYEIEERVAPTVAGLFTLTARLNHDCAPNAEIRSQVFVDCHIDVVATRDIACHEEITISYLGPVRASSSTARRRRELRAKYLFDCCCSLCTKENTGMVFGDLEDTKDSKIVLGQIKCRQ